MFHSRFRNLARIAAAIGILLGSPLSAESDMSPAPGADPAVFGAIKLQVADLERSVRYYRHVFALEEVGRYDFVYPASSGKRLLEVALKANSAGPAKDKDIFQRSLILMNRPDDKARFKATDDLAEFVIIVPDIDAIARRSGELGSKPFIGPLELGPSLKLLFIKDPDGNVIECVEYR